MGEAGWDWDAMQKRLTAGVREKLSGLEELLGGFNSGELSCAILDRQQLCELVDLLTESLSDNNYKISQTSLQCLAHLVKTESSTIKPYANAFVPLVVERLGDTRQQVRQDACELLLSMFSTMGPQFLLQKMARFWNHRAWKVRHGVLQTVAEAIAAETPGILKSKDQNEYIITQVVNLMEDPNEAVRDAALECLQEIYRVLRGELLENLKRQNIRSAVYREVIARLNVIAPTDIIVPDGPPSGGSLSHSSSGRMKSGQGGASTARGEADAVATVRSGGIREGGGMEGGKGAGSKARGGWVIPGTVQVPVVHMHSEKELVAEMEALAQPLAGTTAGWQQRIGCMQRLQGIATGCSPHLQDVLLDNFLILREPMVKQVEDRRSAVSKTACQTLAALSDMYGLRFQDLLLYYMPVLLRITPLTVQVMAEAADQGIRKLLYHCQTPRAIPMLVHTLKTDKNARIRSSCASYLAQAMETWEVGTLSVRADDLESGMKTAAQDASAEARQAARALFAGYAERMPNHASAFLRRLEPWLADKLQAKSGAEQQRKPSAVHAKPFHSFSRPQSAASNAKDEIIIMAPPVPRAAAFTPSTSAAFTPSTSAAHPPPQQHHSMSMQGHPSQLGSAAKPRPATAGARPMGLGPARVEQSSGGPQELVGGTGGPYLAQGIEPPPKPMTSKARRSSVQAYAANLSHTPAQRVLTTPLPPSRPADAYGAGGPVPYAGNAPASVIPAHRPASSPASSSHQSNNSSAAGGFDAAVPDGSARPSGIGRSSYSGSSHDLHRQPLHTPQQPHQQQQQQQQQQQHTRAPMSVPKVAAALLAGPKLWNEKVELLGVLVDAVQRLGAGEVTDSQGLPADPSRDLERLASKFVEWIEESHAKVVVAALEALNECIKLCAYAFDSHMERIMPCLFMRLQDQKDAVRNLSSDVLHEVSVHYSADILLAGLIRALEANKQPKSKMSILEYSTACMGRSSTAGIPSTASSMHLKQWLSRVTSLLVDKNGDLRKRASEALEAVYRDVDVHTVVAFAHHSTGAEGMALKRLLASLQEQQQQQPLPLADGLLPAHGLTNPSPLPPLGPLSHPTPTIPTHAINGVLSATSSSSSSSLSNGTHPLPPQAGGLGSGSSSSQGLGAHTYATTLQGPPSTSYSHQQPELATPQRHMHPTQAGVAGPLAAGLLAEERSSIGAGPGLSGAGVNGYGMAGGVGGEGLRLGAAVTATGLQPAGVYQPSQYSTPYKVDPARLSTIGPIPVDQTVHKQLNGSSMLSSLSSQPQQQQQQQQQHGSDPAAQARLLSLLTHRLASAPSDDTLLQLADLAEQVGPGPWESVFGSLLPSLVHRVCVSPCAAHRELAMVLVHRLANHQPQLLRAPATLQAILPAVLVCEADASKEVMLAASHAVACLVLAAPSQRVLDILSAMLPSSPSLASSHPQSQPLSTPQGGSHPGLVVQNTLDVEDRGEVACAACRCVQRVAHSIPAEELGPRIALDLLPGLVQACDHVRADVRKAAVFAIAEMWHKMGDASFAVHLAKLNQQQQHLVSWAYERIRLAASTRPPPQ